MPNATKAATKLRALVKRDLDGIKAVTSPGLNSNEKFYFNSAIWLDHIVNLRNRCKTPIARTRLAALWYAVWKLT